LSIEDWRLEGFDLGRFVHATLDEDLGAGLPGGGHDVTAESVIPADARFAGVMDSRDAMVVAGLPIAAAFFRTLDPQIEIELLAGEGERVFGLCEMLDGKGVPFILTSGYADWQMPDKLRDRPRLQKPYTIGQVQEALSALFA